MVPNRLKKGDTIGVVAPSDPIIGKNIEEVKRAKEKLEKAGFKVKFAKNLFSNTNEYSSSAKEKAEDINSMFQDEEVAMIWCAKAGYNSNSTFEYLDYEMIRENPKILCGYSDITSLANMITEKTGLVTFSGANFKTIVTDETEYSYQEAMKRFVEGNSILGNQEKDYTIIQSGKAEGKLIGGNLSLMKNLVSGRYSVDFQDSILFIEELGLESEPAMVSNYLYNMKQNGIFDKICGLWLGSYEHESGITLEKIVMDTLQKEYHFPIIKSNNFGHIETKIVIPIGTKAKMDTEVKEKIVLLENCVK